MISRKVWSQISLLEMGIIFLGISTLEDLVGAVSQFFQILEDAQIREGEDKVIWTLGNCGVFSMRSFHNHPIKGQSCITEKAQ